MCVPQLNILGSKVSHNCIKPDPDRMKPLLEMPVLKNVKEVRRCVLACLPTEPHGFATFRQKSRLLLKKVQSFLNPPK